MIFELKKITKKVNPTSVYLVISIDFSSRTVVPFVPALNTEAHGDDSGK